MQNNNQNGNQNNFEPIIAIKTYAIYLKFAPLLNRFPKLYRYSLGQKIENTMLELLEYIFKANSLPKPLREMPLIDANAKFEVLKLLMRATAELGILVNTQYFQLSADLAEIGRMLGGWLVYVRSGPNNKE
jgi:hypothetical protein